MSSMTSSAISEGDGDGGASKSVKGEKKIHQNEKMLLVDVDVVAKRHNFFYCCMPSMGSKNISIIIIIIITVIS